MILASLALLKTEGRWLVVAYPFEPNLKAMSPENLRKFLGDNKDSNCPLDRNDLKSSETNFASKETYCSEGWGEKEEAALN